MDEDGVFVSDSQEMGNMLNTFFASFFTQENQDYLPTVRKMFSGTENQKLCGFVITPDMVKTN